MDCYHLPVSAISHLITQPIGRLGFVFTPGEHALPYTALDYFDHSLRRSNRLLLETEATYELIGPEGRLASQAAERKAGFIAELPDGPLKRALSDLSPLRRLLPIGSGEMQHAVLALVDDQEKTHCRAYLLFLSDRGGHSAALARLQGIKGYDASLDALRGRIQELGGSGFDIDALYDKFFPAAAADEASPGVKIGIDASAFDAANRIISAHIPMARANEHGIIADYDTEFLHDYRVHLRKIRSVLSLFQGIYSDIQASRLKSSFATIMARTNRLRDLDVQLQQRQACHDLVPKSLHHGLDALYGLLADQRTAEQAKLSRYLRSRRYKQEIAGLAALFARPQNLKQGRNAHLPAHDYACRLIWKRYRKVCRIASGIDAGTPDAEVHALRIECKKLRYLMEFFEPVFPPAPFKSLLKPLKSLQQNLGLFNDYSVQQASLQATLRGLSGGMGASSLEIAQSVGALTAVLHARQLEERSKVVKSFAQFNSPQTQQTFSRLFQEGDKPS